MSQSQSTHDHSIPDSGVPAHSSGHDDHDDVASHLKTYFGVFAALLVGTCLTVGMYYVHLDSVALTIAIALFIASIKAFLVAGFFMHLLSEKKTIYVMLAITVVFFIGLGGLTIWGMQDFPTGTATKTHYVP